MLEKEVLRKEISRLRDELSITDRQLFSRSIHKRVLSHPEYQKADTILYFISFRSEIDTISLIKDGLISGKKVVIPITNLEEGYLTFSELRDFEQELEYGAYNILEPKTEYIRPVVPEEIELVLNPGLVFDELGYRIGYGGGYYDRFLGGLDKKPFLLAPAYELQVISDAIPYEEYDIPVDLIATERRLIPCRENREKG